MNRTKTARRPSLGAVARRRPGPRRRLRVGGACAAGARDRAAEAGRSRPASWKSSDVKVRANLKAQDVGADDERLVDEAGAHTLTRPGTIVGDHAGTPVVAGRLSVGPLAMLQLDQPGHERVAARDPRRVVGTCGGAAGATGSRQRSRRLRVLIVPDAREPHRVATSVTIRPARCSARRWTRSTARRSRYATGARSVGRGPEAAERLRATTPATTAVRLARGRLVLDQLTRTSRANGPSARGRRPVRRVAGCPQRGEVSRRRSSASRAQPGLVALAPRDDDRGQVRVGGRAGRGSGGDVLETCSWEPGYRW